jgi:hypothetical protein
MSDTSDYIIAAAKGKTVRIDGLAAICYAREKGLTLNKYTDPTEGAREGLSVDEAREIASIDPSLIWVDVQPHNIRNHAHKMVIPEDIITRRAAALEQMPRAYMRERERFMAAQQLYVAIALLEDVGETADEHATSLESATECILCALDHMIEGTSHERATE